MMNPSEHLPSRPVSGEAAPRSIDNRLAPWIGELDPDPRSPWSRYAFEGADEAHVLRVHRATLRDERCMAALDQRLDAAISRPWRVLPGGTMRRDRMAAEDLEDQLRALDFDAACRQLLHGVWYGLAVAEAIWRPDGARVVLDRLCVRAPDRFRWAADGTLLLRTWTHPRGEPVAPGKFVALARPGEHGDGLWAPGLARWCYMPVLLKRNALRFWSRALERFGAPQRVGKYARTGGEAARDRLLEDMDRSTGAANIAIPDDQEIDLLESARRGGDDYDAFIARQDRAITTTILGQSSTTDQGPWRGTAEIQKDVRDETVASDCRLLEQSLNTTLARWLTAWNYPGAATPAIVRDTEPAEDLEARARRDAVIAQMTGLRPTQEYIEDTYGGEWEMAAEDEPAPQQENMPPEMIEAAARAALADADADDDAVARAVEHIIGGEGWEPLMEPVIAPLLDGLADSGDLAGARARLPGVLARMDDAALAETLRRVGFTARLSGDAGLDGDG